MSYPLRQILIRTVSVLRRRVADCGAHLSRFFTLGALEPVIGAEDRKPEVLAEVERGISDGSSARFSPDIERGFRRVLEEAHFAMFFRISSFGIAFYDLFLLIDRLIIPDNMWLAVTLHLGVTTPVALYVLVAIRRFGSRSQALASVTIGLMLATTLILFVTSRAPHVVAAAEAFSIIIVICNIGVATPFKWALGITTISNTAMTIAIVSHPTLDLAAKVFAIVLNGSTALFSLVGNHRIQSSVRRAYFLTLREALRADDLASSNIVLRDLAEVDGLTGIANRRLFDTNLARHWQKPDGRSLALAMIDVDHFKSFNDRFGHQAGDDALRLIAKTLTGALGSADAVLARYGGEEFAMLLADANAELACAAVAEAMRCAVAALSARFGPDAVPVSLSVSIGVAAIVPGPDVGSFALVAAADAALYRAKKRGRNCVEISHRGEMQTQAVDADERLVVSAMA